MPRKSARTPNLRIFGWVTLLVCLFVQTGFVNADQTKEIEETTDAKPPNILLLMAEDLSPRIGAFGDSLAHTPNIDALAKQGVRFTNVFTSAGVCAPSRAAAIMGAHAISFGAQHMRSGGRDYRALPPPEMKAFPELLRAAGYQTMVSQKLDYQFSGPMTGTGPFTIWNHETRKQNLEPVLGEAPFYVHLNFQVTHESGIFPPLGNWPSGITHFIMQVIRAINSPSAEVDVTTKPGDVKLEPYYPDTETVRNDIARHYDNIATMDAEVGQILAQLERSGEADNTIVIWTTDHGDGLPRAKRELYDSGIHVPMIIRWPKHLQPAEFALGSSDDRLISFVDLAPTLLTWAGLKVPETMQGKVLFQGEPREFIFASTDRIDDDDDRQRAVRDKRFKYIRSYYPDKPSKHVSEFRQHVPMVREMDELFARGELNAEQALWFRAPGKHRLYDLQNDPHELNNLADKPEYSVELLRMQQAMAEWRTRVPDLSDDPESEMVKTLYPDGADQQTANPEFFQAESGVQLRCATAGASMAYRINDADWQIYTGGPLPAEKGVELSAKAVRYGWDESSEVSWPN